jgi:rubrerythrin
MEIFINSSYYIYDETNNDSMNMGRDRVYNGALASNGIDYACISCGYNLKSRACPRCESEKRRVDF